MGIIVALTMLLGLIVLRPTPWRTDSAGSQSQRFITFTMLTLSVFGLWNFLWYGLRHLGDFWGWAAIISGASMIAAALIILLERSGSSTLNNSSTHSNFPTLNNSKLGSIRGLVVVILAASFLLYAITLIQLNMGLPIIG